MSLLGKLFGRRSASEEQQRGDELRARGELGLAKLAYERALELVASEPAEAQQALRVRVEACRDGLARARIEEAERLLREGAIALAVAELEGAAEMAASATMVAEVERRIETVERSQAREQATEQEQSPDERLESIAGSWEEAQQKEYAAHGAELRSALALLYEGKAAQARPLLEAIVESASAPHYLLFELGRARVLDSDPEAGREALQRFVSGFEGEAGGEARLLAHMELAILHSERSDFEAATAEYEAALEAMPDDPRPYLAMAGFFRREGLAAEAIEVLHSAEDALGEAERPFRLTLELGLAHADLGDDARAIALLEEVVSYLSARQHTDLPPECAVPLARLHEKAGNKPRALDLYGVLAAGSDIGNHFVYYREAGRLLTELGHRAEAKRMLLRAAELAPDELETRTALERQLAELK